MSNTTNIGGSAATPPIKGISRDNAIAGATGINLAGGSGVSGDGHVGVAGTSETGDGLLGVSKAANHAGVSAINDNGGFGIWARSVRAGHFEGNVEITGKLSVNQDVVVSRDPNILSPGPYIEGSGYGIGLRGTSSRATGVMGQGVMGVSGLGSNTGVVGEGHYGVVGRAIGTQQSSTPVGIVGYGNDSGGIAGWFFGNVHVGGSITINGDLHCSGSIGTLADKLFKIDHPLFPSEKYLAHACVESSERKNLYDGMVVLDGNGEAEVVLPDWFQKVNTDFHYQLTCVGAHAPVYISTEVDNNRFRIAGGRQGLKVCWMLTGTRCDQWARENPFAAEIGKPGRGT